MDEAESFGIDIWKRPQTEELVDLHVYLVPSHKWIEKRKLAKRDIIDHAISSGFVRVLPSTTLLELRCDIGDQLGTENISETFVFLRSVGRNFTQVKFRQEHELKVKSFLPPYADEPEIYIKEGGYVLTRSASLGADVPISLIPSVTHQVESSRQSPEGIEIWPPVNQVESGDFIDEKPQGEPRSLSLDRAQDDRMASARTAHPQISPRKYSKPGANRPPTPRVKERTFSNAPKRRAPSVPKRQLANHVKEKTKEPLEEEEETVVTLSVHNPTERVLNSPPPRSSDQSRNQTENELIQIPVPSPVILQSRKGKNESPEPNQPNVDVIQINTSQANSQEPVAEKENTQDSSLTEVSNPDGNSTNDSCEKETSNDDYLKSQELQQVIDNEDEKGSEKSHYSFDSINSRMGSEDVIVDPIKLLQDEGESLKNFQENSRDHFDEGFHSGELVASEEENSVDTLMGSSTNLKEEDENKPIRAATPMPKATSFYVPVNMDTEIGKIQTIAGDLRSERRLKELQRDTLMQKIRELQKKKASTKDQMREEWRRRYMEVKKSTPRLEDHCSKLRQELEKLVKDMLVSIKHAETESKPHKPSKKTSYKIMIMRHLQEVEDLRRRLQSVTVKLNAETKLRAQAEYEVKKLRQDLLHKKTQVTLTRKQTSFPQTSEQFFISAV